MSNDFKIDVSYIRGFFDGEGCVRKKGAQIYITNTEKSIIDKINLCLITVGIPNKVRFCKAAKTGYKDAYRIDISSKHDIKLFLDKIGSCHPEKEKLLKNHADSYEKRYKSM